METTRIATDDGMIYVPSKKMKFVKHLCVTMKDFGVFDITHIESGMSVVSGFERAESAYELMLRLSIAINRIGEFDCFNAAVKSDTTVHECLEGQTIMSFIELFRLVNNEFPWEDYKNSPQGRMEKLAEEFFNEYGFKD